MYSLCLNFCHYCCVHFYNLRCGVCVCVCADYRYEQSFEEVMEFEDADPANIKNVEKY